MLSRQKSARAELHIYVSYHCGALSLRSPPDAPSWDCFSRAPPPWCVPPWGCTVPPWVYRAAVGCTVPPWVHRAAMGVPCRHGVCPARAPRWREHQRRSPHSPSVGLDRCFRGLTGSRAGVEKAPAQTAYSPLWGLTGRVKSAQLTNFSPRPAHQLYSGHSSPTLLRTQLTNFTPDTAHPEC